MINVDAEFYAEVLREYADDLIQEPTSIERENLRKAADFIDRISAPAQIPLQDRVDAFRASGNAQGASEAVKLVYVKRWRTIVKLPAKYANEIVEALRAPGVTDDPFNRRQVEAICRAVCTVEDVDPDSDVYGDGCDPQWKRYADAVAEAISSSNAQRDNMAQLSASEVACYRWPEDTDRALREAFCDGAAHISRIVEEVPANKGLQEETLSESGIPNRTQATITSTYDQPIENKRDSAS